MNSNAENRQKAVELSNTFSMVQRVDEELFERLPEHLRKELKEDFEECCRRRDQIFAKYGGKMILGKFWRSLPENRWAQFRLLWAKNTPKKVPPIEVLQEILMELKKDGEVSLSVH